jgi:hypothetical protein
MQFDQHATKTTYSSPGVNSNAFMYSCEFFMLRVSTYSVQHSADGVSWSHCEFELPTQPNFMAFGLPTFKVGRIGNTFFLYANVDANTARIYKSTDGLNWTVSATISLPPGYAAASFNSANDRLFLTLTNSSTSMMVASSSDGFDWVITQTPVNTTTCYYTSPIAWNGSVYCLITNDVSANENKSFFSSDGLNWTLGTTAFSRSYTLNSSCVDIAVYNNKFYYAFYNSSLGQSRIWSSPDGSVWTSVAGSSTTRLNGFIVAPTLLVFYGETSGILTTPDGTTWTSQTFGVTGQSITSGVWDGSRLILNSQTNSTYRTSTDGVTWAAGGALANQHTGLLRPDVAVMFGGNMYVFTRHTVTRLSGSTVSVVMSGYLSGTYVNVKTIAKNGNTMVYVAPTGLYTVDLSTLDHKTSLTLSGTYYSVTYGNGKFVAAGNGFMAYSSDGVTWTPVAVTGINMAVAYGNGLFVAIRAASTDAWSSPDGINWTQRVLAQTTSSSAVIQFASGYWVIHNSATNDFQGSRDGINWVVTNTSPIGTQCRLMNVANRHVFSPLAAGNTGYIATGPRTATTHATFGSFTRPVYGYNAKLDHIVSFNLGISGSANDQVMYQSPSLSARNTWTFGNVNSTFSPAAYSIFLGNGVNTFNINPNQWGSVLLQIPDTTTMLFATAQGQLAFIDGSFANASFSNALNTSFDEFIFWYAGNRNCELQSVWTDDGSLYVATGGNTAQPQLGRFQLGVLYTNPHYNVMANSLFQYRRLG